MKKTISILSVCLIFGLLASSASAIPQVVTLKLHVTSCLTGLPISGATVNVVHFDNVTSEQVASYSDFTNEQGRVDFDIEEIVEHDYVEVTVIPISDPPNYATYYRASVSSGDDWDLGKFRVPCPDGWSDPAHTIIHFNYRAITSAP